RQVRGAPAVGFSLRAGREGQVRLARPRGTRQVERRALPCRQRLQLRQRTGGRRHEGVEALVGRIAQRQRQLPRLAGGWGHASSWWTPGSGSPRGAAGATGARTIGGLPAYRRLWV